MATRQGTIGGNFIGCDLGGTTVCATGVDGDGNPILPDGYGEERSLAADGPAATIQQTIKAIGRFLDQCGLTPDSIGAVATTVPAPTDLSGIIRKPVNLVHRDWQNCPYVNLLADALEDYVGRRIPVRYINDCNAAGRREAALRPNDVAVAFIAPGTGFGGAYVEHGRVLVGRRGMGAELGHAQIVMEPFRGVARVSCGCGRPNCVEATASLTALQGILPQLDIPAGHPLLDLPLDSDGGWKNRSLHVRGLASAGDSLCRDLFLWQADAIGALIAQIAVFYDPDVVVIGGGWLEVDDAFQAELLQAVGAGFKTRVSFDDSKAIRVEPATEGDLAGALGAALYALDAVSPG